jgi:iron complex outermembrane receptor protein
MPQIVNRISALRLALAISTSLAAPAAYAQTAPAAPTPEAASQDAIIVTGFRKSLEAALNMKKSSVSAVDAIVAEDIAKFPDQNLAESMQRITGVAITRDGGEGKQITVRGLDAKFTVTRVNGMMAQAAAMNAGSGGSVNRDRSFDFNVFASELFKSLIVHKTAEASVDEGSLGAVVDLNTGHPLGGKYGMTGLLSVSGSYNDLSKSVGPRVTGLLNWKNAEGTLGINASVAYSKGNTLELGNNTTRWVQTAFKSVTVGGVTTTCLPSSTTYTASAVCDAATLAFHPRIPRYGIITHDRERLGLTGSVEWQPDDKTHFEIDGLFSRYHEQREEKWAEILLRSNEKNMTLVDPTYDSAGNMVSGTLNNAYNRNEHYLQIQNSTFYQLSATLSHQLTDTLKGSILAGGSKSVLSVPTATTIMFDNKAAQGYSFNYSNPRFPVLSFGTSVTDPANYQLSEVRDAPTHTNNTFKTVRADLEWQAAEQFVVKGGASVRRFGFDTWGANRNTLVCPSTGRTDAVLGTLNCTATAYGFPVTSSMVDTVTLGNAGQPAGTTGSFIVANLPATTAFTNLYARALTPDVSNTRSVEEEDKGAYIQADWKTRALGMDVAVNAGLRYANTSQDSTGLQQVGTVLQQVTVHRSYTDLLPSANLNLFPAKDLILRAAVAKAMTRPSLGNLTPGGSVDSFNYKVSYGNPFLDPYRATNFDVGLEWYFARGSLISVAFFHKDVESFPVQQTVTGTFASTGLPTSILSAGSPAAQNPEGQSWTITKNVNGAGAKFDGIELGLQSPLRFLPGTLKNLGVILNATFVKSNANYAVSAAGTTIVATGSSAGTVPLISQTITAPFFGMSKVTWNATLYYERGPFSVRSSYSYRGPYNDQNSATGNVFEGYSSYTSLDAALRYSITKNIEVSVDASNLLDSYTYHWTDQTAQRNYESQHVGRTITVGARLKI